MATFRAWCNGSGHSRVIHCVHPRAGRLPGERTAPGENRQAKIASPTHHTTPRARTEIRPAVAPSFVGVLRNLVLGRAEIRRYLLPASFGFCTGSARGSEFACTSGNDANLYLHPAMHQSIALLKPVETVQLVRENQVPVGTARPSYENGGSEVLSRGSVTVPSGGCWSAELEVRMGSGQGALLTLSRSGPAAGPSPSDATLVIPPGEADAFLTLLMGIVHQARADGVLERASHGARSRRSKLGPEPPDAPTSSG